MLRFLHKSCNREIKELHKKVNHGVLMIESMGVRQNDHNQRGIDLNVANKAIEALNKTIKGMRAELCTLDLTNAELEAKLTMIGKADLMPGVVEEQTENEAVLVEKHPLNPKSWSISKDGITREAMNTPVDEVALKAIPLDGVQFSKVGGQTLRAVKLPEHKCEPSEKNCATLSLDSIVSKPFNKTTDNFLSKYPAKNRKGK